MPLPVIATATIAAAPTMISREEDEAEHQAHAALADQVLAPGLLQQHRAFLHGVDGADVARHQDRHHQEAGERSRPRPGSRRPACRGSRRAPGSRAGSCPRSRRWRRSRGSARPCCWRCAGRRARVGSPPSSRIIAAPTSAELKKKITKYCTR